MGEPSEKLLIDLKLKNVGGLATKETQTEAGKLMYAFLSESETFSTFAMKLNNELGNIDGTFAEDHIDKEDAEFYDVKPGKYMKFYVEDMSNSSILKVKRIAKANGLKFRKDLDDMLLFNESVNEAKLSTVHRAAKKGSYPAVIVVVQDGKVIHQEPVSTPDVAPATFNVMQEKYPKALLHLEDKTGKRLFSESVNEANSKYQGDPQLFKGDTLNLLGDEWEVIKTDYKPNKVFKNPFTFTGTDYKQSRAAVKITNKNAVGYLMKDKRFGDTAFLYQYIGSINGELYTKFVVTDLKESAVTEAKDPVYKKGQKINYQLYFQGGVGKYADAISKSKDVDTGVIRKRTKNKITGSFKYELTNGLELSADEIVGLAESVNEEQGKLDFGGNELKDLTTKLWKGLQWKKKGNKYTYKYGTGFLTIELKNGKVVGAEFSEDRSYDFLKHMDDKGFGPNIYGSLSALAKDRKIKGYNTILMFESLNEGQFSWMTHDSDAQIGSEATNRVEVYMFDNEGNKWKENRYEGYGEFGGKDYYDLLATMNGYTPEDLKDKKLLKKIRVMGKPEMRQIGIALAFDDLKPKNGKKVLYPALVTNPRYNWKRHNFEEEAETDPNQSWAVEDDYDDDDDYGYYDESANESWMLPRFESFVNENENRVYGMFTDDQGKPTKLDKELLDIALKGLPSNIVKNIDAVEANGYGKSSAISPPTVSNKGQSRGEIEYHKIGIGLLKPMGKNKITAITLGLRKRTSGPGTGYLFMKVAPDWRHNLGPDAEGAIEFWEDPASFLQKLYNEKFKNWF